MKKIAMCIPTKNRPEMVARVLKVGARIYSKYPLDIFYYDSSDNDESEKIIAQYQEKYANIHYIPFASFDRELGARKIPRIFEGYGREGDYDYLWLVKDRQRFLPSTLDAIFAAAEAETDVIFLGTYLRNPKLFHPTESYNTTPEELYRDWGWRAASEEAVVFNIPSMLGKSFSAENCERICAHDYNIYWLQHFWLFHRLSAMDDCTIRVLVGEEAASVAYKHGKSEWEQRVLKVWKEDWIQTNEGLPDIYDPYKSKVILEGASLSGILGGVGRVKELYQSNVLTKENLEYVLTGWEKVSDVPPAIVRDIVNDIDESHDVTVLYGKRGDTVDFLIKIIEKLREGRITPEQVPFQKIEKYVHQELSLESAIPIEERTLLDGLIKDMDNYISKGEMDMGSMQSILQCLVVLVSFIVSC